MLWRLSYYILEKKTVKTRILDPTIFASARLIQQRRFTEYLKIRLSCFSVKDFCIYDQKITELDCSRVSAGVSKVRIGTS